MPNHQNTLIVRDLGLQEYKPIWQAMQKFTAERNNSTADELWCLQHPPIFTMGLNGKEKHLLNIDNIPVINIDRGGQVTYHAPGQLIIYTLIDLARLNIGVKDLVNIIERSIIQLLARYKIIARGKENAPGVYVEQEKIAALGLRIKRNKSYHGLSLNIDMDLNPFLQINPCGYEGLQVTQITDHIQETSFNQIQQELVSIISRNLGYEKISNKTSIYDHLPS
ncbi:MAG: lipoyl(octanoyl) transferase LipB [Woeseiaceae bacterium]